MVKNAQKIKTDTWYLPFISFYALFQEIRGKNVLVQWLKIVHHQLYELSPSEKQGVRLVFPELGSGY